MELVPSQYTAIGRQWRYRFSRADVRGVPMWSIIRWPADMPYIPPVAELLVSPPLSPQVILCWSPLLATAHPTRLIEMGDIMLLVNAGMIG